MKTPSLPFESINGEPISPDQARYLSGFFAGVLARGQRFSDLESVPGEKVESLEDLIFEERVKRELHPLDAYPQILEHAAGNMVPGKEEVFRFKWNGLFYLTPVKDAFMARLRIPGGRLRTYQLRELAEVAKHLTSGYVQVTTRANLQMRLIAMKDTGEFLRRIQQVGLHTRGSGADNVRNLTANPTAGIDPVELLNVMPYCEELGQIILNERVFYDLPRKFNIAYDGGGLVGSVEDTNDIGCKAVEVEGEVWFRIAVGGATGHKAFANDLGVLVRPAEVNKVVCALLRVYLKYGNRSDRKKARLKHLLESWSLGQYLEEAEKVLGYSLRRAKEGEGALRYPAQALPHSHVGVYKQRQEGLHYVGVAVPVGHLTPKQMTRIAEIADLYGSGEVRLTVWQNLLIPNISEAYVETVKRALLKAGLDWRQSHVKSGIIACTGNAYCKYAQADTKGHALELSRYLEGRVPLDQPVNIHFTGCPHSCAQHYMGDIGLLGTKAKIGGESVDGYHIFVGGGFGEHRAVGRQVFTAIDHESAKHLVEKMLLGYLRRREAGESFQAFTERHDLNALQRIFSNGE